MNVLKELYWWATRPMIMLLIVLVVVLNIIGTMNFEDVVASNTDYCSMVEHFTATDGAFGWPDYENRYNRDCP